ncbi:uncharacterized protein LOC128883617 isoform X2 [Hylaeus volcanicus]|uniref:uncharacterized protein LOC128883617 isoform X2 n=1 Tax=Hylaeus volcanicus TaxID=313075 RepID=UPI0023B858F1|nr:uncharacterized protein LOC128883617 isoform X2 [Hylaeus volcanicus]
MQFVGNLVDRAMFPGTDTSYYEGSFEELFFISMESTKIPCALLPFRRGSPFLIIYAHGNGTDIGDIVQKLQCLSTSLQAHILTFDYPGYGCFSGNADMALVDKVMDRLVDFAKTSLHWPLQNIILFGCSIGTGPCTRFARNVAVHRKLKMTSQPAFSTNHSKSKHKNKKVPLQDNENTQDIGGLILQCPYRSIRHAAEKFIGNFMSRLFVETRWNIEDEVQDCSCPVLWIHGKKDELFDWKGSEKMYNQYSNSLKMLQVSETATHLSFNFTQDIVIPVRHFIDSMVYKGIRPVNHYIYWKNLPLQRFKPPSSITCAIPILPPSVSVTIYDLTQTKNSCQRQRQLCRSQPASTEDFRQVLSDMEDHNYSESPYCSEEVPSFLLSKYQYPNSEKYTHSYFSKENITLSQKSTVDLNKSFARMELYRQHQCNMLQTVRYFNLDNNNKTFSKNILSHEKHTCQDEPTNLYSGQGENSQARVDEKKHIKCRVPYDIRYLQHLWPLNSLRSHIQKSTIHLAYTMLKEAMGRKLYLQIHEELYKARDWVRRFYSMRCRHFLGIDLVYRKQKSSNGETIAGLLGMTIAGRFIQLSSNSKFLGCVSVEKFSFILDSITNQSTSSAFPDLVYSQPDYLIFPMFSPKADIIFSLTCWLVEMASKLSKIQAYPATLTFQMFSQHITNSEADMMRLQNLSETILYDFCMQYRRPSIERLSLHLGNFVCFGWDQLLGIVFKRFWPWFQQRAQLFVDLPTTECCIEKEYYTKIRKKKKLSNKKKHPKPWFQAFGWSLYRNWFSNRSLCHGIYLKNLYLENDGDFHEVSEKISTNQQILSHKICQWHNILSKNPVTTSGTSSYVNSTPCNNLNIVTTESNTLIQNNSQAFSNHENFTSSNNMFDLLQNELQSHASHLTACLKSALCTDNFLQNSQNNTHFQNINESTVKEKYFNVFSSFSEILMSYSHQNMYTHTAKNKYLLFQLTDRLLDPEFFCSPFLKLKKNDLCSKIANKWITFLLTSSGGVCLTKASRYQLQSEINEDRMQYAERCREENNTITRATRYSICHHHLFHFVLTQPGRYYQRSTFVAIDSLWRLIEILSGVTVRPRETNDHWKNKSKKKNELDQPPSDNQKAVMLNVTLGLMLLRSLHTMTVSIARKTKLNLCTPPLPLNPNLIDTYPGVYYAHIRLFDELSFALKHCDLQKNDFCNTTLPSCGGYNIYASGWESGCYPSSETCLLASQLESIYAIFTEVLEGIDANTVSESISPLGSQGRLNFFDKHSNDVSLNIDDYLTQKKKDSKKTAITKCGSVETSTAASLRNEIFESPIISLQSSNITCGTLFSSNDVIERRTHETFLRKKKYNWVLFYTKIKSFRKTRIRVIRDTIHRKLISHS